MKPYSIDHFLGKELVLGLVDSPEAMTYIGILIGLIGLQDIILISHSKKR